MQAIPSNALMQPSSPTCAAAAPDPMAQAVATLFRTFARAFGPRWTAVGADPKAPLVWERKLLASKIRPEQVLAAIGPATDLAFPPTLGEFVALARPRLPDETAAMAEAGRWARGEAVEWSHPVIGATARAVGSYALRNLAERDLRRLWADAWRQMAERFHAGDVLDVPTVLALPREVRRTRAAGEPMPPAVAEELAKARALLGLSP